jgi:hypothetical protein
MVFIKMVSISELVPQLTCTNLDTESSVFQCIIHTAKFVRHVDQICSCSAQGRFSVNFVKSRSLNQCCFQEILWHRSQIRGSNLSLKGAIVNEISTFMYTKRSLMPALNYDLCARDLVFLSVIIILLCPEGMAVLKLVSRFSNISFVFYWFFRISFVSSERLCEWHFRTSVYFVHRCSLV